MKRCELSMKSRIAIIGATSHIAKGLINSFLNSTDDFIYLFARNISGVNNFLESNKFKSDKYRVLSFDRFRDNLYDVVINCVGIADPGKQKEAGSSIFFLTETFDNMILDYLKDHIETLYINFSSGAVYGTDFDKPVDSKSSAKIMVNDITDKDYYRITKLYSEAKHRSLKEYNIVDLRIFSYFSRFIDLESSFFMTDIVKSLLNKTEIVTTEVDTVRDYIGTEDLFRLVRLVADKPFNGVWDCYSAAPVRKFEILDDFYVRFGLRFQINKSAAVLQSTGSKNIYFSLNRKAEEFGYRPQKNSLECLIGETKLILGL